MHAGVALQVVEVQWDDVLYVHQLLQEYFAARVVAAEAQPALAASAWRADEIVPRLAETLATRADSDPLPEAPATGWEETFVLASAMAADPEKFVTDLIAVNLPLAGRCAAQPEVRLSPSLRERLQKALVERSRDPAADLRVDLTCPSCQAGWTAPLDPPAIVWAEIGWAASRLLREVHELAAAYGWSESGILTLTPARRQAYLDLVRAGTA